MVGEEGEVRELTKKEIRQVLKKCRSCKRYKQCEPRKLAHEWTIGDNDDCYVGRDGERRGK